MSIRNAESCQREEGLSNSECRRFGLRLGHIPVFWTIESPTLVVGIVGLVRYLVAALRAVNPTGLPRGFVRIPCCWPTHDQANHPRCEPVDFMEMRAAGDVAFQPEPP